ncbi:MAG: MBL fold metallo-hydrolase [Candidatus Eremiobacteraeota bacterium]|nr:MBL fold metallo-hydrolase [Candidatus Eremiobacteraeota bacterium]
MIFEHFAVGPLACNCVIVGDAASGEAVVVDGGDGVSDVLARLKSFSLRAKYLVHTHAHIDHIGNLGALRAGTGATGLLHPADLPLYAALVEQARWLGLSNAPPVVQLDGELRDGDVLSVGALRLNVLHTPGHTPGSVTFAFANTGAATLLTGDTLFRGSIGRWDLGGTSMDDIVTSIHRKLMDYADATTVVPGHGPLTSIGHERKTNPYLQIGAI